MPDAKPWNVLIYMSADNNLSEEAVYALTEIYRLDFDPNINVVAQLDSNVSGLGPKRYVFNEISQPSIGKVAERRVTQSTVSRKLLNKLSDLEDEDFPPKTNVAAETEGNSNNKQPEKMNYENFADPRVLKQFIETSATQAGARNFLILSGHGSGPVGDFMTDNNPPATLKLTELKDVLDELGFVPNDKEKLDILGLDSCLMSMVEICYQLSDNVQYLVGSEGFVLEGGWPYYQILEALNKNSGLDTQDFACLIVEMCSGPQKLDSFSSTK